MKTLPVARINSGLKQVEVCKHLDISQAAMSLYESGGRAIPRKLLNRMCALYEVHPSEITLPRVKDRLIKPEKQKRADALRIALGKIINKDDIDTVLEICRMIIEVEK